MELKIEVVALDAIRADDVDQWNALFETQITPANPFCTPEWVTAWYRWFTREQQRLLLFVRAEDRLVGVAPLFHDQVRIAGLRWATRVQLVGAGQGGSLLELPQVLTAVGQERAVLRAVVEWLTTDAHGNTAGGWAELSLAPTQGWFESSWLSRSGHQTTFSRLHAARACVTVPLAPTWAEFTGSLKRNVKESLRRSRNRLKKDGRPWEIRDLTGELDVAAVDRLLVLHRQRSDQDNRPRHWDAFGDPVRRDFLRDVLPQLGRSGRARMVQLHLDGEVVACQLLLHAPSTLYVHSSGFEPSLWDLAPITYLQEHAFRQACERGDTEINMSPGPNLAKLRWSERVSVYHDFSFGAGPRSLLRRYLAFAAGQAATQARHEAEMMGRDAVKGSTTSSPG